jgi:3-hydroxyisobutyrate dehydrogenase-like beta-hydroxyacid dehydrogenase
MNKKIQKIGWIGTGVMGAPMAGRLIDAGYTLTVYNRTKAKAEPLIQKGAVWVESPGACAKGQDMVITMVGYPKDVEEVYFGEDGKGGVIAAADEGTLFVDMTTTRPSLSVDIAKAAEAAGLDPDQMLKSIGGGAAGSWQMQNLGPKMAEGDYAPGFFIKHLVKDLTIADTEAEARKLHLVVLKTVLSMYKDLRREGMGELGTQALSAYYDAKGQEDPFDA